MSTCWDETRIEEAAIRLALPGRGTPAGEPELEAFLRHADECVRCGELLAYYLDVERRVAAGRAALSRAREGKVIPLLDVSAPDLSRFHPPAGSRAAFALAADSGCEAGDDSRGRLPRSLEGDNGRYLVRILPSDEGEGAVAIFMCREGAPGVRGAALRIGEDDFQFDASGHASLPAFPQGDVRLVIH
jgi:hypothetical protein